MWDCQMATYRVMPPSTSSSYTMSVCSSPAWGRAHGWLSIFAERAGPSTEPASTVVPRSGATTVGAGSTQVSTYAGTTSTEGLTLGVVTGSATHPARARAATTTTRARRARGFARLFTPTD